MELVGVVVSANSWSFPLFCRSIKKLFSSISLLTFWSRSDLVECIELSCNCSRLLILLMLLMLFEKSVIPKSIIDLVLDVAVVRWLDECGCWVTTLLKELNIGEDVKLFKLFIFNTPLTLLLILLLSLLMLDMELLIKLVVLL